MLRACLDNCAIPSTELTVWRVHSGLCGWPHWVETGGRALGGNPAICPVGSVASSDDASVTEPTELGVVESEALAQYGLGVSP